MESAALEIGRLYTYRENRRAKSEMLKAKLIAKVGRGGKVKIRFEEGPHPGLEEYVRTANPIVSWGDRKAVLRDEERSQRLDEYSQRSCKRSRKVHHFPQSKSAPLCRLI